MLKKNAVLVSATLSLVSFLLVSSPAKAVEIGGFLTSSCEKKIGLIVDVSEDAVSIISLEGRFEKLLTSEIETLYVYNVIENPFKEFKIDESSLAKLRLVYLESSDQNYTVAFPVRFIEDLVLFYSIEGKSHVYTFADIHKLRPASSNLLGTHKPKFSKETQFEFSDQSSHCPQEQNFQKKGASVRPTRVLADKISISEFFDSFHSGYEALDSFQERTYLYAKPFIFERKTRLGLIFQGERSEPGINLPMYFQWSSGEAYRFQSFSAVGLRNQEFSPNTEPVFSLRSDVKSHGFHGLFMGNVAGLPAGNSIFLDNDFYKPKGDLTVQPSFNYLAMMGGDYGPYSLSVGFFYPVYSFKVRDQYREVLGTSVSYAVRGMITMDHWRVRAIGALTDYSSEDPTDEDVITHVDDGSPNGHPDSYSFHARFIRGGIDYDFSDRFKLGIEGILVNGNYKEAISGQANDLQFNKLTIQSHVTQSFSDYVSLTAFVNVTQNDYRSNFYNIGFNDEQRETRFFGSFEFIF